MSLDRSLKMAFSNFSTLALAAAVITVPAAMILAAIFRTEIAVSDLASQIANLPTYIQVHSVGENDLQHYRIAYWAVTLAELALLPVLGRVATRIIDVAETGGVPTVIDGYAHALRRPEQSGPARSGGALVVAALISVGTGVLCRLIGMSLIAFLPQGALWMGAGLVEGTSRAVAAPFFLACWASRAQLAQNKIVQHD